MVDVDQECAERLPLLHGLRLRGTEELLQRAAVGQSGQRVGPRPLFRLRQRFADDVELARLFGELRLELGRARGGLAELLHQGLDQKPRIDAGLGAVGDLADRLDLRPVVGNGRVQELLRRLQHRMQLLGDLMGGRVVGALRSDIGRVEVAVGRGVELALVGDQDVDGALQLDRRAERIFEPDMEILRRRRDALLR